MSKKLSKSEIKIISVEIVKKIKKQIKNKRAEQDIRFQEFFEQSEAYSKLLEMKQFLEVEEGNESYGFRSFRQMLEAKAEKDFPEERIPFSVPSYETVEHEISLEQITKKEDFDLEKLIEKYTEKYA